MAFKLGLEREGSFLTCKTRRKAILGYGSNIRDDKNPIVTEEG